jgi:hypothetical protein
MRYVPYLREKEIIKRFMICFPTVYKDKIEFLNLETMDEVIRHAKLYFNQFKERSENTKPW